MAGIPERIPPGKARTDRSRPTTAQSRDATRMSSHGASPRSMRLNSVGEMPAAPRRPPGTGRRRCGPRATPRRDRRAGAGRGGRHGTRETRASAHPDRAPSPADQPRRYHRTMTLTDTTFEEYLDATRDERLESYKAFLRIPSISALPEHRDDCPRNGNLARRCARTRRRRARGPRGDDRQPGCLRGLAPCRSGRAHRPRLRPLRRAAGRPARPVDLAAVRARRRRRPDARSRLGRRQGPDPPPRHGPRRPPGDARHPARQRALPVRGQRGGRRAAPARSG